ncbi:Ras- protein Rab-13 [Conglomerata obtusa]
MTKVTSATRYKVLIVGESNVGKTSILTRFTENTFEHRVANTIGIDFTKKDVQIDNRTVCLQVWDTAGQERFRSITKSYYRGADAILLVFSLTDEKTFNSIDWWMRSIRQEIDDIAVPIVLVGSKVDEDKYKDYKKYEDKANEMDMKFICTSAKTGFNVEEVFVYVARKILENDVKEKKSKNGFKLSAEFVKKSGCC